MQPSAIVTQVQPVQLLLQLRCICFCECKRGLGSQSRAQNSSIRRFSFSEAFFTGPSPIKGGHGSPGCRRRL
eukprot:1160015-Pleurochrysis_carterae.AAC.1